MNGLAPDTARHRHGVPVLRALSAPDGGREYRRAAAHAPADAGCSACPARAARRRPSRLDRGARCSRSRRRCGSRACSPASRRNSRAARSSAWRSPAPWCAGREVFLMDEPLSNLDAELRVHMRAEIAQLHRQLGATFIYVTHDQAEAMTMSDRVAVILERPNCSQIASPGALYRDPDDLRGGPVRRHAADQRAAGRAVGLPAAQVAVRPIGTSLQPSNRRIAHGSRLSSRPLAECGAIADGGGGNESARPPPSRITRHLAREQGRVGQLPAIEAGWFIARISAPISSCMSRSTGVRRAADRARRSRGAAKRPPSATRSRSPSDPTPHPAVRRQRQADLAMKGGRLNVLLLTAPALVLMAGVPDRAAARVIVLSASPTTSSARPACRSSASRTTWR